MKDRFTSIGVVGLGLIGGSLCRAFLKAGKRVVGIDADVSVTKKALSCNAVSAAGTEASLLAECDAVFLALYPSDAIHFAQQNAALFKPGAVVIDCCGVKQPICGPLFELASKSNFIFMGGHPMAGTERSGFDASDENLFQGASFLLVPGNATAETAEQAGDLIRKAGFARVIHTTPQEHDRMIAFTSQLPHVIACSYVMSPSYPNHSGFSAGSLRDVSRVAHLSADMWTQLFLDNREPLCAEIDTLIENLAALRSAVGGNNAEKLRSLLSAACRTHDRYNKENTVGKDDCDE